MEEFIRTNGLTILVLFVFTVLVSYPERSPLSAGIGLMIMYTWVYFSHRVIHMLPTSVLNLHVYVHHQHEAPIDRRIELFIEAIHDLFMSLNVLLIQSLVGIHIVPTSVILFYGILYTSVHIVNYSLVGNETHRGHHKNMYTNYGPDTMDHLFGTSGDGVWEDLTPITMNAVMVAPIVLGLKELFHWKK